MHVYAPYLVAVGGMKLASSAKPTADDLVPDSPEC